MLHSFINFTGAQALRTYFDMLNNTVFVDFNRLDIGVPFTPRVAVRVGDVVTARLAFAADSAFL